MRREAALAGAAASFDGSGVHLLSPAAVGVADHPRGACSGEALPRVLVGADLMPPRKRGPLTEAEKRARATRAAARKSSPEYERTVRKALTRHAEMMFRARASLRPPEKDFEYIDVDAMESELIQQTAQELNRLGKLHTMLGAQALAIARGIVRGSGSELATLSKEHSRLMAAVADGQSVTSDPLDAAGDAVEEKRRRAQSAAGPKAAES